MQLLRWVAEASTVLCTFSLRVLTGLLCVHCGHRLVLVDWDWAAGTNPAGLRLWYCLEVGVMLVQCGWGD